MAHVWIKSGAKDGLEGAGPGMQLMLEIQAVLFPRCRQDVAWVVLCDLKSLDKAQQLLAELVGCDSSLHDGPEAIGDGGFGR